MRAVAGSSGTAVAAALMAAATTTVVALVVGALPAQSAPRVPGGDGTATTPLTAPTTQAPTDTPIPTPSPNDTGLPTVTPTAAPTPTPSPTSAPPADWLMPDLVSLPAQQPYLVRRDARYLRFSSSLGNIGAGPIEVRPQARKGCRPGQHATTQVIYRDANGNDRFNPTRDTQVARRHAGCMVYHRFHAHWHFKASARYTLFDPRSGDEIVSERRKVSFCLRDTARVPAQYGTWAYPMRYGACSATDPQGIQVGWMDVYQGFLAGQALRLPGRLPDGVYCLSTVVDPLNQLLESNDENNTSLRAIRINGMRAQIRPTSLCR